MLLRSAMTAIAAVGVVWASGAKPPVSQPPVPNSAEVRIANEIAPAGGTTQIKFSLTNPQPIMSGGTGFDVFQVNGVSLASPGGDAAGAAYVHDGRAYIYAISPLGDLALATDYPFLT